MSSIPEQNGGPPAPIFNMIHRFIRESFDEDSASSSSDHDDAKNDNTLHTADDDKDGDGHEHPITKSQVKMSPTSASLQGRPLSAASAASGNRKNIMRTMNEDSVSYNAISNMRRHSSIQSKMRQLSVNSHSTRSHSHSHHHSHRDPPARERPKDNKWPDRDSLSFTRSLVFYGTGSITDEHERACKHIMEARLIRKNYFGSRGDAYYY